MTLDVAVGEVTVRERTADAPQPTAALREATRRTWPRLWSAVLAVGRSARDAGPAMAVYAALKVAAVVGIVLMSRAVTRLAQQDPDAVRVELRPWPRMLRAYDGNWLLDLAGRGYRLDPALLPLQPGSYQPQLGPTWLMEYAFFPGYPMLVRTVDAVLPGGLLVAGLAVTGCFGLLTAWGLFTVGRYLGSTRAGIALAGLWAVVPSAVVQVMAYSETMFTGLAVWALYAVLRRYWLTAGLLCLLAGLTRATGGPLAAAVCLAALAAVVRNRGRLSDGGWRPYLAMLLAPAGFLTWFAVVGVRLGRPDAYFLVQGDLWGTSFDGGRFTLSEVASLALRPFSLGLSVVCLTLLAALAMLVLGALQRLPWPLLVYAGLVFVMSFGASAFMQSKARLLIPAFPLLLPAALGLGSARRSTLTVVLVTLGTCSAWYGGYLLFGFNRSP